MFSDFRPLMIDLPAEFSTPRYSNSSARHAAARSEATTEESLDAGNPASLRPFLPPIDPPG